MLDLVYCSIRQGNRVKGYGSVVQSNEYLPDFLSSPVKKASGASHLASLFTKSLKEKVEGRVSVIFQPHSCIR